MAIHLVEEANRCLLCRKPRCQEGCPVHTDIPGIIGLFKERKLMEAGERLFRNNPMSVVCAQVCDHQMQCAGHCIQGIKSTPVHFYEIEHFVLDKDGKPIEGKYEDKEVLETLNSMIPLWKKNESESNEEDIKNSAGIRETLKVPGVILTLVAFFAYCAGEATCFLWTPSYFAGTRAGLSDELIASFGSLIFGGLMLGRLISGFISNKLGDRLLIRIGIIVELVGILFVFIPTNGCLVAAVGFVVIGTGMGPVYPAIQHMAPTNFGKRYSAAVIGLQMASAYVGSTFMPMVFGHLQQAIGIGIMPLYLLVFAVMNVGFLELTYKVIRK